MRRPPSTSTAGGDKEGGSGSFGSPGSCVRIESCSGSGSNGDDNSSFTPPLEPPPPLLRYANYNRGAEAPGYDREDATMVSAMTGDDDDIAIVDGDSASQNDGVVDQQGGDDNAIQELSNNGEERRGQDGGCDHQEILLDAEVELSPLQISRIPSSPVTRGRTSAQTSICGVPVAQAVHSDGDDEDDEFVESPRNTPTRNLSVDHGGSSSDRNINVSASHLRYLGDDVVVAVAQTAHEDIMERGEADDADAGGDRTRRSSSGNGSHHEDSGGKCGRFHHVTPRGRRMRCLCILGGIVLVILAVVGPVGHVMARRKKYSGSMDDSVRVGDAAPPTSHPTVRPHSKEHELILQLLDPFLQSTGSIAHKIPTSPQYRAMEWIEATSLGSNEGFNLSPWINLAEGIVEALPPEEGERLIQRYVLAVLYHSLGGDQPTSTRGWTDNLNFLSHDVHECEWTSSSERPGSLGVICDENMRVVEINLGNNNLSGTLPQNELHGLTHLRKIDLSSNEIEGPLPEDLGQLSNLQALCMEDNSLTGTFPASYGQLTSLEELNLVDNELVGSIPSQVGRMTSLTNIWLNQNKFTDGMNNFCRDDIPTKLFYADCFCRTFPLLEPEVKCRCCTICCAGEGASETCYPNVSCQE